MNQNSKGVGHERFLVLALKTPRFSVANPMNLTVFHQQSKLHMEGFRSLREGEAVEFTFKKSSKGLESVWVTGPNGAPCLGNERRPKSAQKRRAKADRYVQSEDIRMLIWDLNTSTF